ncbi:hypothetical protein H5410_009061, partial [Solanum commersonii]
YATIFAKFSQLLLYASLLLKFSLCYRQILHSLEALNTSSGDRPGSHIHTLQQQQFFTEPTTLHRIFSQEIPSDVTINAGGISFTLHKFPLVSKSGYIGKLVLESNDADVSTIEIPDIPGGGEAFEFAAKFCYGINFEMSTENIALLRCVAEYLEMTEDYAVANLVGRTEAYFSEVAIKSIAGAVTILRSSENLLPIAEKVKLVSRCIDTIAYTACKDNQFSTSGRQKLVSTDPRFQTRSL